MAGREGGTFDVVVSERSAAAVRRYLGCGSLQAPDAVQKCGPRTIVFRWVDVCGVQRGSLVRVEIGAPCRLLVDCRGHVRVTALVPEQPGGISELRAATNAEVWRALLRAILSPWSVTCPIGAEVVGLGPRASAWMVPNLAAFKGSTAPGRPPWRRVTALIEDHATRALAEIGMTIDALQKRCAPELSLHLGIVAPGRAPQMLAFAA